MKFSLSGCKVHRGLLSVALLLLLSACANPAIEEAGELAKKGDHEAAFQRLSKAEKADAGADKRLRNALLQQRDTTVSYLVYLADAARVGGQIKDMSDVLARLEAVAPQHPRVEWLRTELTRMQRHQRLVADAEKDLGAGQYEKAETAFRAVLTEDPSNTRARAGLGKIEERRETQTARNTSLRLANAAKPVTLEFREAALKTVFETLARAADVNFVFDKEVRGEAKVTLFLRHITVDEALRVILSTQQLSSKLLNDNTVLVFPATQQKQRELLDTVTRTFYLVNADPKQVQTLIRTVAKTRDIYVDERLNMLIVRDTPEVVRLVERLVQSVDLPDPEVMLELEVMEVSDNQLDQLGLNLPQTFSFGADSAVKAVTTATTGLRWSTANPLALATLRATRDRTNLLANPKIRARNREKAKVLLGEKLPVFTTTSTIGSTTGGGVPTTAVAVTYVDVGLKLDVEPQVQMDNDVTIKVALEVSSITSKVTGPGDSIAYQVGTRQASTTLRLKDGETQILAGLINDSESRSSSGVPGLHDMPIAGRLFGTTTDEHKKTEIVLLVTPHVIRNIVQPAVSGSPFPSGTEAQPGAGVLLLSDAASTSGMGGSAAGPRALPSSQRAQAEARQQRMQALTGPEQVMLGAAFQVSVHNPDAQPLTTTLVVDPGVLNLDMPGAINGRVTLTIPPGGAQAVPLRVLPGATSTDTTLSLDPSGVSWPLKIISPSPSSSDRADPLPSPSDDH